MADVAIDTDVVSRLQKGTEPAWVGRLAANAQQRGRPRPQNDTWVAACCIRVGVPLVTLNLKDFADFATYERLILLDHDDA